LQEVASGVPYQFRPISADDQIRAAQQLHVAEPSDGDEASPLPWRRSDDVIATDDQSAAEDDPGVLTDHCGRSNPGNSPADTEPGSEEVQQLIKVSFNCSLSTLSYVFILLVFFFLLLK